MFLVGVGGDWINVEFLASSSLSGSLVIRGKDGWFWGVGFREIWMVLGCGVGGNRV